MNLARVALAGCASGLLLLGAGACSDGVTPDCPAMPLIDPDTGEPVGPTRWADPDLGPGGALNRWTQAAAARGCATLPGDPPHASDAAGGLGGATADASFD